MRILTVITQYWPYRGGAPNYMRELLERFARDGDEVTVYTTNAWDLDYLFRPDRMHKDPYEDVVRGVRIVRYPVRHPSPRGFVRRVLGPLPLNPCRFLFRPPSAVIPGMWRDLLLRGRRYDIVVAGPSPFYSLIYPAYAAARLWRAGFVAIPFVHVGPPDGDSHLEMHTGPRQVAILRKSDLVVVQSTMERDALVARGVPAEKTAILGGGVNPDDVAGGDAARFRARHGIGEEERIVAYIGVLNYDKGAFHAVEAVSALRRRGHSVRLAMLGHPSVEFQGFFGRLPEGARECCTLLGSAGDDEKADLLAACDLLVLPSRADSYGIVLLEAWLAGKPVIGCHAGGIPAVVSDGVDGYLVPFGDAHMLAEYILLLTSRRELVREMGERGRRKTTAELTWDLRYRKVREIFEGVLTGGATT